MKMLQSRTVNLPTKERFHKVHKSDGVKCLNHRQSHWLTYENTAEKTKTKMIPWVIGKKDTAAHQLATLNSKYLISKVFKDKHAKYFKFLNMHFMIKHSQITESVAKENM